MKCFSKESRLTGSPNTRLPRINSSPKRQHWMIGSPSRSSRMRVRVVAVRYLSGEIRLRVTDVLFVFRLIGTSALVHVFKSVGINSRVKRSIKIEP